MTTELKLDYDNITVKDVQLIFHHRAWLLKYFSILEIEAFETKNGYHVLVTVDEDIDPRDVMLIQILLGSDINREIFNFIRNYNGELMKHWNRLYTKKYLLLITKPLEVSGETVCPQLLERITHEIDEAEDLRGRI